MSCVSKIALLKYFVVSTTFVLASLGLIKIKFALFASNIAKVLAEVFGVVYELLSERKIKNTAILPIKWKAHFKIAGKGRAQEKKMAQSYVMNNYNIACTEDEADSLCIALYHYDNSNVFDWS